MGSSQFVYAPNHAPTVLLAMIDPGRGCEPGIQAALWQIKKA
jgi:hypothetical protein